MLILLPINHFNSIQYVTNNEECRKNKRDGKQSGICTSIDLDNLALFLTRVVISFMDHRHLLVLSPTNGKVRPKTILN